MLMYFQSRANRDTEYTRLRKLYPDVKLRRRSSTNQLFHPAHVEDMPNRGSYDDGFGNGHYDTLFSHLYVIEDYPR